MVQINPDFKTQSRQDWCHLCGKNKFEFVNIWGITALTHNDCDYLRICSDCVNKMQDTIHKERVRLGKTVDYISLFREYIVNKRRAKIK